MTRCIDQLRGTGRTTRMLREAIDAAKKGRAVYVIAATQAASWNLRKMIAAEGAADLGIKVETPQSSGFDLQTMTPPLGAHPLRAHPNRAWFVDHFTIESRYMRMLDELHRYDPEPDGSVSAECLMRKAQRLSDETHDAFGKPRRDR